MLRIGHFAGQLSDREYEQEISAVDRLLEREIGKGKKMLRTFRSVWHAQR
jgi:hypothetical protein